MGLMDWFAKGRGSSAALDDFHFDIGDPLANEHATISQILAEDERARISDDWYAVELAKKAAHAGIASLDLTGQSRFAEALVQRLAAIDRNARTELAKDCGATSKDTVPQKFPERWRDLLKKLLEALLQKRLPLSDNAVTSMLTWCVDDPEATAWSHPLGEIATAASYHFAKTPISDSSKALLSVLSAKLLALAPRQRDLRKPAERISALLGHALPMPLKPGKAWTNLALQMCSKLPTPDQASWIALLAHARNAASAAPAAKWEREARLLMSRVGIEKFRDAMLKWFPLWEESCPDCIGEGALADRLATIGLEEYHAGKAELDVLRGLAWMCGFQQDHGLARALTSAAVSAYRKIPGTGLWAVGVGNACITALGMMPGRDSIGQLALLKVKVKFGKAQIAIEKALTAAAAREGLPREELEEMSVPAYGLTEVGRLVETLGEFTAELKVAGTKSVEIIWRRADGKVQKSLPAAVKKEFAEELKELNAAKKDIEKMLPAQAERIDSLFLQQKTWPLETWLERYLEHPLVGTLARRLIWNFTTDGTTTPGLWLDGKLVDRLGHAVPLDAARATVALWHPLDQPPDVVLGWRAFLEEWQIVQPFKQAHREVYVLTPAEERTGTYSNRFAAHILKQHQFNALCQAKRWKNSLLLCYDGGSNAAVRSLPEWGLQIEFWVQGAGGETNETGIYLYVATDQVRFLREIPPTIHPHDVNPPDLADFPDENGVVNIARFQQAEQEYRDAIQGRREDVRLHEIPPLVFSEIMRDVDLFVGVASVGNDPAWADGGRREVERNAWAHFSFGELSATAQTRRDLLQRLVPKLKIASRCSFEEKFLVVRGDLRTYKIHLGSGNILMSPNDQYLCIVPGSSGKAEDGKVFLPFEGDRTLSVILSKAFRLAADAKITDPSITRQIRISS